jgi:hypothetical protein
VTIAFTFLVTREHGLGPKSENRRPQRPGTDLAAKNVYIRDLPTRAGATTRHKEVVMGKKAKLPKRILGMKIPKQIRKGPLGQFLASSGGQVVVVETLLAAAAFYGARRIGPDTSIGETLRHPLDSLRAGRDWSRGASDRFARALRAGLQSFRASLQESEPAAEAQAHEEASDTSLEAAAASRPKRASARRETRRQEESSGPH